MFRRTLACLFALGLAAAACSSSDDGGASGSAAPGSTQPNIVVIMTDDQTVSDMQFLPRTRELIGMQGTTFLNSFASFPLCCPSRATQLTGQYAHNHHVLDNVPPTGGNDRLDHSQTVPVWLQHAGYNTAHVGKYLNGYGETSPPVVEPGYDDWFGLIDPTTLNFYDYEVLDNGKARHFGEAESDYQTDVLADRAVQDIDKFSEDDKPFFLQVWTLAPHSGHGKDVPNPLSPAAAPRDANAFADLTYPRTESFMEADRSDKPQAIQDVQSLIDSGLDTLGVTPDQLGAFIDETYRARARSLRSVDDLVGRVVDTLQEKGELDNTVIVFTSDNGWMLGEHAIPFAKVVLYEESIRVPLLIRGPGFPAGTKVQQPVANIDLAPTFEALAGAKPSLPQDGISLLPLVTNPEASKNRAILIEGTSKPAYVAVRVPGFLYADYGNSDIEFYDLLADPKQLESKPGDPKYEKTRARLADALQQLATCSGDACHIEVPQAQLRG